MRDTSLEQDDVFLEAIQDKFRLFIVDEVSGGEDPTHDTLHRLNQRNIASGEDPKLIRAQ